MFWILLKSATWCNSSIVVELINGWSLHSGWMFWIFRSIGSILGISFPGSILVFVSYNCDFIPLGWMLRMFWIIESFFLFWVTLLIGLVCILVWLSILFLMDVFEVFVWLNFVYLGTFWLVFVYISFRTFWFLLLAFGWKTLHIFLVLYQHFASFLEGSLL